LPFSVLSRRLWTVAREPSPVDGRIGARRGVAGATGAGAAG
jgi:hypothetical protein